MFLRLQGSDFDMLDSAHQIRTLAYRLWEEQGCPVGRDKENWFEAERLLSEIQRDEISKQEKKARRKKSKAARKERISDR